VGINSGPFSSKHHNYPYLISKQISDNLSKASFGISLSAFLLAKQKQKSCSSNYSKPSNLPAISPLETREQLKNHQIPAQRPNGPEGEEEASEEKAN